MTIDEAIKHAEEVADFLKYNASRYDMNDSFESYMACQDEKCAAEHRQLAEWLKELKAHREAWKGLQHDVYELHKILFNMKPQHRSTTVAGDILGLIEAYRPKEGDVE